MRWWLKRGWMYVAMVAISVFALFPVYWVVITSLKPRARDLHAHARTCGRATRSGTSTRTFSGEGRVGRALMNSLIVAGATTVICLAVGAIGGLRARALPPPRRARLLMMVLMTQMFPLVVLVIPLFVMMRKSNLLGTYWSLIITYLAFTVPLAIWVMRSFVLSIPEELEHAARIDGATRVGAMVRVVLPLAAPGLAVSRCCRSWKAGRSSCSP